MVGRKALGWVVLLACRGVVADLGKAVDLDSRMERPELPRLFLGLPHEFAGGVGDRDHVSFPLRDDIGTVLQIPQDAPGLDRFSGLVGRAVDIEIALGSQATAETQSVQADQVGGDVPVHNGKGTQGVDVLEFVQLAVDAVFGVSTVVKTFLPSLNRLTPAAGSVAVGFPQRQGLHGGRISGSGRCRCG